MFNSTCLRPLLIAIEKIQIPEYLSLYGSLKNFFDIIMSKNNDITGN